jgi:hypothetical protein
MEQMIEVIALSYQLNHAILEGSNPLTQIDKVGTGGISSSTFFKSQKGYPTFYIHTSKPKIVDKPDYPVLMSEIQDGFGRTMFRLSEVFGVSRQTLYNWKNGDTPKEEYRERFMQLHKAARVFSKEKFKPGANDLDIPLLGGQSILKLISQGGDGQELSEKLIRVILRSRESNKKLEALLKNKVNTLDKDKFSLHHLNELS